jgi:small conductance mechanosensitive channel
MSGDDLSRLLTAIGTVLLVLVVVFVVDRAFKRRGAKLAERVVGENGLDPVLQTRLRFVKRMVEAAIVVIGIMIALSQFTALDRFAASILASGAIAAAVIGFAAQQSLGNVLAGVLLAVTQPIRIGDLISFNEHSGVVEDIRLAHTFLRTGTDARIVVPNGQLAQSVVRNDSIVTSTVGVETELWLAHESDELRALDVIREAVPGATPVVKAVTHEGTVLAVSAPPTAAVESAEQQSELLRACLQALRNAGLR